jgi:hypothetical protein
MARKMTVFFDQDENAQYPILIREDIDELTIEEAKSLRDALDEAITMAEWNQLKEAKKGDE